MFTSAISGEKLVRQFDYKGVLIEVMHCPATIWCGAIAYASDCAGEPDIETLQKRYQERCRIEKAERANPDWSCAISIDYWRNGAVPRGMCFAQQVLTEVQNAAHDVYVMPESLYLRTAATSQTAQAILGKDACEPYELFDFLKEAMKTEGYSIGTNGAQEIEMYSHEAWLAYAYVQVKD